MRSTRQSKVKEDNNITHIKVQVFRLLTRQAMCTERNTEACSCNHCCSGKSLSITYSDCVFIELVFLYEMSTGHTIHIVSLACLDLPYFSTLSHKWYDFRRGKKVIDYKMCVLISATTSV